MPSSSNVDPSRLPELVESLPEIDALRAIAERLFSGTNLLAMKVAPWGSVMTVILTQGASNGGTTTSPPSSAALSAVASASSTANVTLQCAGTSGWSSAIGLSVATTSSKPAGAPISAIRLRRLGIALLQEVAVAGQPPHLGAASEAERLPSEHRAVEGLRALRVAGIEAVEVQASRVR